VDGNATLQPDTGQLSGEVLFQALQDSHLPIQRGKLAPQLWQT
jgi:hypothetical protein